MPPTALPARGRHAEAGLREDLGYGEGEIDASRRDGGIDRLAQPTQS
jgi:hypothetical protein